MSLAGWTDSVFSIMPCSTMSTTGKAPVKEKFRDQSNLFPSEEVPNPTPRYLEVSNKGKRYLMQFQLHEELKFSQCQFIVSILSSKIYNPCYRTQIPNNKMAIALQKFITTLVLDVLHRKRLSILKSCRVKRHSLNLSLVLITKLQFNVLPVSIFKALVSKINFKKETFIPERYQEPIKFRGNTGIFFSDLIHVYFL